ncbi:lysozyme inhibitor LprI family protein [Pseudoduganella lutea]|uniref:DUF1311 domain-containing protein n=1 Tax=Pseudoduganella lutea TaxID=321985 RepID=A0A4P6L7H5_9BURK|nr:lysozyme inhibitor LprI family protein [Pseudoduganella lutea]QBE66882.1 DUF1311 domain-containing protein [Pseudoduganella lutea]
MGTSILCRSFMLSIVFCCVSQPSLTKASEQESDLARRKQEHCEQGNMRETTFCMNRELKESDTRLNVVYKTLVHALVKPQGLQSVQRAWIVFRDAECKFQNEAEHGGSSYNYSMDLCLMRLTEQRISALEAVMPCNGCVEFKDEFYRMEKGFRFPERKRIPASGRP